MLCVLLVVLLTGCPRKNRTEQLVRELLAAADQAWENRGTDGFAPVETLLDQAHEERPRSADVLWRRARLRVGEGLAEAEPHTAAWKFGAGRSEAIACLDADPGFAQLRHDQGWERALEFVNPGRQPCLAWAAYAWARWLHVHGGDAAALDVPAVRAIIDAARKGEGTPEVVDWAEGLLSVLPITGQEPDHAKARKLLKRVMTARPNDLTAQVDLLTLVAIPTEKTRLMNDLRTSVAESKPRTPEDRAAKERAKEP